jgi:hypothetical protein
VRSSRKGCAAGCPPLQIRLSPNNDKPVYLARHQPKDLNMMRSTVYLTIIRLALLIALLALGMYALMRDLARAVATNFG